MQPFFPADIFRSLAYLRCRLQAPHIFQGVLDGISFHVQVFEIVLLKWGLSCGISVSGKCIDKFSRCHPCVFFEHTVEIGWVGIAELVGQLTDREVLAAAVVLQQDQYLPDPVIADIV